MDVFSWAEWRHAEGVRVAQCAVQPGEVPPTCARACWPRRAKFALFWQIITTCAAGTEHWPQYKYSPGQQSAAGAQCTSACLGSPRHTSQPHLQWFHGTLKILFCFLESSHRTWRSTQFKYREFRLFSQNLSPNRRFFAYYFLEYLIVRSRYFLICLSNFRFICII